MTTIDIDPNLFVSYFIKLIYSDYESRRRFKCFKLILRGRKMYAKQFQKIKNEIVDFIIKKENYIFI